MRNRKKSLLFVMMIILMAAFSGKTLQADPTCGADLSLNCSIKNHPVPFRGSVNAMISSISGEIPVLEVTVDGTGNVTHLGKVGLHLEEVIYFNMTGAGVSDQHIVYTAANGDQLYVHAVSNVVPRSGNPTIFDVESTWGEFTGGTGRFEEAAGSYQLRAIVDTETGKVQAWVNGTIQY